MIVCHQKKRRANPPLFVSRCKRGLLSCCSSFLFYFSHYILNWSRFKWRMTWWDVFYSLCFSTLLLLLFFIIFSVLSMHVFMLNVMCAYMCSRMQKQHQGKFPSQENSEGIERRKTVTKWQNNNNNKVNYLTGDEFFAPSLILPSFLFLRQENTCLMLILLLKVGNGVARRLGSGVTRRKGTQETQLLDAVASLFPLFPSFRLRWQLIR